MACVSCGRTSWVGVVNEVMPLDALMPRAWALARQLAKLPTPTLRDLRVATSQLLKEMVVREVGHGHALQGLGAAALGNPGPDPRREDRRSN